MSRTLQEHTFSWNAASAERSSGGEALPAPLDCSHSLKPCPFLLTCACSCWVSCLLCLFFFLTLATSCHPLKTILEVSSPLKLYLNNPPTTITTLGASCSFLALPSSQHSRMIVPLYREACMVDQAGPS